jgi:hypothetical protein
MVKKNGMWYGIGSGLKICRVLNGFRGIQNSNTSKNRENNMKKTWVNAFGFIILMFTAVVFAAPVPDTGQTKCYDAAGTVITCPSPGQALYGQDANYSINPMSYTKLNAIGIALPDSATSWVMVKDNVTGLIWEMKNNMDGVENYSDPHDADNTYNWYDSNPATNGGDAGTPGDGKDTEAFIKALNTAHYGGYSDWRMPTIEELGSIVCFDTSYPGPTTDAGYFPNTQASFYWSSSTYAYYTNFAWGVYFSHGHDDYYSKDYDFYVRAVRGGRTGLFSSSDDLLISSKTATVDDHYVDNNDGTVTDTYTGLMWQQETPDNLMTWEQALSYCENLSLAGYTDWRLPTIKEQRSIVDYSRYKPAINLAYFPDTNTSFYWSSTTYAGSTNNAWGVYFNYGYNHFDVNKNNYCHVRAVRGGHIAPFGNSVLISNSIGSRNTIKISDMSGTLPASGGAITVSAWDVNGNMLPESEGTVPLKLYNHGTNSITGSVLAARFLHWTPMLYKFSIDSSDVVVTNVKINMNDTFKVSIVYLNGVTNFVSNSIGNYNTVKISDVSGVLPASGIAISVLAWDANGNALAESVSAAPLKLYNHGTTSISGSILATRFPAGSPMTYEFNVQSAKVLITNIKSSTDGKLNIPVAYTSGISNFVSNFIENYDTLKISDISGTLPASGSAISVLAWDANGNSLVESGSAEPLTIYNHGTTSISGSNLAARFPTGTPTTYEFNVQSAKVLVTNIKSSNDGFIEIPCIFTRGISNFATNYVSSLNTIKISDTSGAIPADGIAISITAWDTNGNLVLESGSAAPLKLYNLGTITIEGTDIQSRFPSGLPALYEFSIGSSSAIVTSLTTSLDGTIETPAVFTIGAFGGI